MSSPKKAFGTEVITVKEFFDQLIPGLKPTKELNRITKKALALEAGSRKKSRRYPESDLQQNIISELGLRYPRIRKMTTATGAGGKRNAREAARMKAEGLTAGFPDLVIYIPAQEWDGYFCELKAVGKKPNPAQREKIALLQARGYYVCVCDNANDFWKSLEEYFGIPLEHVK